jgi:hypothetical protein
MPKAKPTHVIVHRIELQEKERELLEPFVKAKEVEQVAKSVAMVGGAAALGVGAYVAWWTFDSVFGWMGNAKDKFEEMTQQIKEYDDAQGTNYEGMVKRSSPIARVAWWAFA